MLPVLVDTDHPFRARPPLPVGAVKRPNTSGQSPLRIAAEDVLQLGVVGGALIRGLILSHSKLNELPQKKSQSGPGQAQVLNPTVSRFSVGQHPETQNQLQQWAGLGAASGIDRLPEAGLVPHGPINARKDRARHTETPLKLIFIKHWGLSVHAKVVPPQSIQASRKVTLLIGRPAGHRDPVP